MFVCWCLLIAVRVLITLWPQSGYIHPDEFFQSVEIAAGDLLEFEIFRPWEFNSSFPVRSIVPVYLLSGPPLMLLQMLEASGFSAIMTTYSILVFPRLFLLLLSFLLDLCVFRILNAAGHDGQMGLLLVSSSYVSLVYFMRTFSNSLEGILFAALLLDTLCPNCSLKNCGTRRVEDPKAIDAEKRDNSFTYRIPVVIVVGLFNRPTFAAFAAVPFVYWTFSGSAISNGTVNVRLILQRIRMSVTIALFVAFVFVICDSIYFSYLTPDLAKLAVTVQERGFLSLMLNNLTITPLNFIRYNTQVSNLAEHGIHARYMHVLANVQILFCVLGIFAVKDLVNLIISFFNRERNSFDLFSVILLSYFVPLILLSIFPHQEPRFLIPLLCPLIILSSSRFSGQKFSKYLVVLWLVFNIATCLFFGFCHQGGIVPAISKICSELDKDSAVHTVNVVFWKTYMPPRHLFLQGSNPLFEKPMFQIHDLAGSSKEELIEFLNSTSSRSKVDRNLLVSPGTMNRELGSLPDSLRLEIFDKFWPHFSGENLPTVDQIVCQTNKQNSHMTVAACSPFFERIYDVFSLHVYHVSFSV